MAVHHPLFYKEIPSALFKKGQGKPAISFNASSFLQKKLKGNQLESLNVAMTAQKDARTIDLTGEAQLFPEDIKDLCPFVISNDRNSPHCHQKFP